ncbi:hypothetical protein GCM10010468_80520 [Actinocorallia longicatena]|uniref:ATP-grasp target RiPP n=1 Tax=Actinocorallia longicatena TaxID=111803 RepID=A0ABP6QP10_9ACTN
MPPSKISVCIPHDPNVLIYPDGPVTPMDGASVSDPKPEQGLSSLEEDESARPGSSPRRADHPANRAGRRTVSR